MNEEVLEVRAARPDEEGRAACASALIEAASLEHDIAPRSADWLAAKIRAGKAALALLADVLVGFGYWSEWEGGAFVSHSGLVVRTDLRGRHVGRRLKTVLMESSRAAFPRATLMSLTTSDAVKALNASLGFRAVSFERVTTDEEFWDGCKTCRNYEETRRSGRRCCCEAMILEPETTP